MKNYQKIYNRLIKEIQKELEAHRSCVDNNKKSSSDDVVRYIEHKYGIDILMFILSILDEIEGKKCNMIIMNRKEFKQWKKKITTI